MRKDILVSICCITYNHQSYIKESIEGFLMQKTNFSFEIIIHDDASTDRTPEIIKDYEKKHPDLIKPIYQTENQYSKGREVFSFTLEKARGKYIAICEGDDYWTVPYKLQKQVDFLEAHPEYSACYHHVDVLDMTDGKYLRRKCKPKKYIYTQRDFFKGNKGETRTCSTLARRDCLPIEFPEWFNNVFAGDNIVRMMLRRR